MSQEDQTERLIGNKTASEHALDGQLIVSTILLVLAIVLPLVNGIPFSLWQAIEDVDVLQIIVDAGTLLICAYVYFAFLVTLKKWFVAYRKRRRRVG